jgi:DNA-binding transcriptional regulator YdaS (Cro superfamily)
MRLSEHLKCVDKTTKAFAAEVRLPYNTVRRYLVGERFPTPTHVDLIQRATRGKVTADDWQDQWREQHRTTKTKRVNGRRPLAECAA